MIRFHDNLERYVARMLRKAARSLSMICSYLCVCVFDVTFFFWHAYLIDLKLVHISLTFCRFIYPPPLNRHRITSFTCTSSTEHKQNHPEICIHNTFGAFECESGCHKLQSSRDTCGFCALERRVQSKVRRVRMLPLFVLATKSIRVTHR